MLVHSWSLLISVLSLTPHFIASFISVHGMNHGNHLNDSLIDDEMTTHRVGVFNTICRALRKSGSTARNLTKLPVNPYELSI